MTGILLLFCSLQKRPMKTRNLMPERSENNYKNFAEGQVIILFIIHFKEKFSKLFFLSFQQP